MNVVNNMTNFVLDNVHVTRDAMHSSLFEMLMCIVVVLDPIVGF